MFNYDGVITTTMMLNHMLSPKRKTAEVVDILNPSLAKGECLLDDLTLFKLSRDIKSIPDDAERLFVQGLLAFIKDDSTNGIAMIERALKLNPHNDEIWMAYFLVLSNYHLDAKSLSVLEESIIYRHPAMLREAFIKATNWGRVIMSQESESLLKSMNLFDTSDFKPHLLSLSQEFKSLSKPVEFEGVCRIVSEVAEKFKIKTHAIRIEFRDLTSFIAMINTLDSDMICEMNFEVMSRIVKEGLGDNDYVGYFDACEE